MSWPEWVKLLADTGGLLVVASYAVWRLDQHAEKMERFVERVTAAKEQTAAELGEVRRDLAELRQRVVSR